MQVAPVLWNFSLGAGCKEDGQSQSLGPPGWSQNTGKSTTEYLQPITIPEEGRAFLGHPMMLRGGGRGGYGFPKGLMPLAVQLKT